MKTLYLLRHAKSSRDHSNLQDFDRPLNERGYADAHLISKYLVEKKIHVDVLISSPAIRALSTALIFARNLDYSTNQILIRHELYDSDVEDYLSCIMEIDEANSILLVGHNDTISEVAQKLSVNQLNSLKTCSIVCIQFEIYYWKNIRHSKGNLIFQLNP